MKTISILLTVAAVGLCTTAGNALAEKPLPNLVTIASRTPIERNRIGNAISIVDRELLDQRQSVSVADILQDLPGLAISRAGGPGQQTQLRIRGAEANHVLVVIDGVRVNDPAIGDEFGFEQLSTWDIDNIEVVRGPQSALWGSDAMAGVINITTRRENGPTRAQGFAEGGSFGTANFGGWIGGSTDRLSGGLSLSRYASDGSNISRQGGEDDGYDNFTVSLNTDFQASDNVSIAVSGRHTDSSNDFDAIGADGLPTDAGLRSDVKLNAAQISGTLDTFDRRWIHKLQLAYSDSDRKNLDTGVLTNSQASESYSAIYQTSYDFMATPERLRGTLAIDHKKDRFSQRYLTFAGADQNQSRNVTGYVAELIGQPLDGLDLAASIRYDDFSDIDNKTTYRITGSWRVRNTGARLHSSYGTGIKQATFTELFGFFPNSFVGNPDLKPEQSKSFDIGIEQSILDGRVIADLTWFDSKVDDEIQTVFGFPLSTVRNADGTSRQQGVEFQISARLAEGLDATGSYTYTDASEPDGTGGRRREVRRPRHMAAVNLNYRFAQQRANLNLNLSYTGEQTDQFFPPFPNPATIVSLDSYTLVNLTGSYRLTDTLEVYARAENLLDEDYQNVFGFNTPGVGYYAGIRLDFGGRQQ